MHPLNSFGPGIHDRIGSGQSNRVDLAVAPASARVGDALSALRVVNLANKHTQLGIRQQLGGVEPPDNGCSQGPSPWYIW